MVLENKLGLTTSSDLAREEERLSKKRAIELFEQDLLADKPAGLFSTLAFIHAHLFGDIYPFAGEVRTVNLAKGHFRFAPTMYLVPSLKHIDAMPQETFDQIVDKYVEMNIAHPFREGNGRAGRLWLDHLLKNQLGQVVDWSMIDKEDYLLAMERSPIRSIEIKYLIQQALTSAIDNRQIYMKGLDASYHYEGYITYKSDEL